MDLDNHGMGSGGNVFGDENVGLDIMILDGFECDDGDVELCEFGRIHDDVSWER